MYENIINLLYLFVLWFSRLNEEMIVLIQMFVSRLKLDNIIIRRHSPQAAQKVNLAIIKRR